jgi:hypothetical protein
MNQIDLIHKFDWNHLIILDACRYDYFERQYKDHLVGSLTKVYSPATHTVPWIKTVFPDKYDITYFSTNPHINSSVAMHNYLAGDHFKEVIDIWKYGWYDAYGTVLPLAVNMVVYKKRREKSIIHYMQPHGPWIGKTKIAFRYPLINVAVLGGGGADGFIVEMIKKKKFSLEKFRQAYADNLDLVLYRVAEIIPHLKGKIVVSSDHGEMLGEDGYFLHPFDETEYSNRSELRDVPWLIIKGRKK